MIFSLAMSLEGTDPVFDFNCMTSESERDAGNVSVKSGLPFLQTLPIGSSLMTEEVQVASIPKSLLTFHPVLDLIRTKQDMPDVVQCVGILPPGPEGTRRSAVLGEGSFLGGGSPPTGCRPPWGAVGGMGWGRQGHCALESPQPAKHRGRCDCGHAHARQASQYNKPDACGHAVIGHFSVGAIEHRICTISYALNANAVYGVFQGGMYQNTISRALDVSGLRPIDYGIGMPTSQTQI